VVTADTDFPMMLALRGVSGTSVVLLRHVSELTREEHARLLTANLPLVVADLESGAIVSLSPVRLGFATCRSAESTGSGEPGWLRLSSMAQARLRRERAAGGAGAPSSRTRTWQGARTTRTRALGR
jgi:hypothetical protein